jgi:hypothetical protein
VRKVYSIISSAKQQHSYSGSLPLMRGSNAMISCAARSSGGTRSTSCPETFLISGQLSRIAQLDQRIALPDQCLRAPSGAKASPERTLDSFKQGGASDGFLIGRDVRWNDSPRPDTTSRAGIVLTDGDQKE